MPALTGCLLVLLTFVPLCGSQGQQAGTVNTINRSLDPRFVNWLNSLFYLPQEGDIRVRREYRVISDQERLEFHRAIRALKEDTSVPPNKFDALASLHHLNTAQGAHGGPNFLGWHRVYLVLCENALREKSPNITIPYWDNTIEQGLANPRRSILFSEMFMGTPTGQVVTGHFRFWSTPYGPLRRDVGNTRDEANNNRRLMTPQDITAIMNQRLLADITNPSAPDATNIEELHNDVHVYIGEQMSRIERASYDPMFYIHHCFIDYLWEEFRTAQRARGIDPSRDYPRIVGEQVHQPLVAMGLGQLLVIDGINDIFTRRIYRYERRPSCQVNNCGSRYLRCNWDRQRCLPVVMTPQRPTQPGRQAPQVPMPPPWWARNGMGTGQFIFG